MEDLKENEETKLAEEAAEAAAETAAETEPAGEPSGGVPAEEAPAEDGAVAALTAELAEAKDRNMRLYADFENFRRRMAKEQLDSYRRAEEDILGGLLPVLDNFERALAQAGEDPLSEGVKMVYAGLCDFLKKRGVEAIEAMDQAFDPGLHEAVAYQPSPDKAEGTVMFETRKGYRLGDRVIRPSSVIVSSGAPGEGQGD